MKAIITLEVDFDKTEIDNQIELYDYDNWKDVLEDQLSVILECDDCFDYTIKKISKVKKK